MSASSTEKGEKGKKRKRKEENVEQENQNEELPKRRMPENAHDFCVYILKIKGKGLTELRGGEGIQGGGIYVGQTDDLGYRLYRHRQGWEEGTKEEVSNGEVWEVTGTVTGFGRGVQGMRRAKGVEEMIKKETGKGFQRKKFEGDGEAHNKKVREVVEKVNEGKGNKGDAWKHWGELLQMQWWGGEGEEKWRWKKWKDMAEERTAGQRSRALERHAATRAL